MNSEDSAQTMVNYYSTVTPLIRNQLVYMQYSNHKELKTNNSPSQVVRAGSPIQASLSYMCSYFRLFYCYNE